MQVPKVIKLVKRKMAPGLKSVADLDSDFFVFGILVLQQVPNIFGHDVLSAKNSLFNVIMNGHFETAY